MLPEQGISRELSLSEVISKTFDVYRQGFTKFFVLFAVVGAIIGVVTAIAQHAFIIPTLPSNPTPEQLLNWLPGFFGALVPLVASIGIVNVVLSPIAQGGAIKFASEQIEKGKAELGPSVRFAASKLLWIWALNIIVGVVVILGFIALIIPGIVLAIMFALSFPALLLENKGVFDSMGRSRQLVSHRWSKTFATFLVLGIITAIASAILSAISGPFGFAGPLVNGILSAVYQPLSPILLVVYYYSNLAKLAPASTAAQGGTKFCANCGAKLASPTLFCSECGAKQPLS